MLRWQEEYRNKTITALQAANMIKNGDRIMTGNRDARAVLNRIMDRDDLRDVYYYAPIINYKHETPNLGKGFRPATSFLNETSLDCLRHLRRHPAPGRHGRFRVHYRHQQG